MEFEINIKLLLFHTNAGTDMHVRLESPRTRASSEAELRGKLQKMSCTPPREKTSHAPKVYFRQHRNDVIFGARTQATASSINQPPSGIYTFAWLHFASLPLTARAPSQTDEAFILDAFGLYYYLKQQGATRSNCPLKPSGITSEKKSFAGTRFLA